MKILVISDNHGDRDVLVDVLNHNKGKVDAMVHLGDSELSATDEIWQEFTAHVGGNCDFDRHYLPFTTVDLGDEKLFLSHGHLSDVRYGLDKLYYQAKENQATVALFGHTHELGCEYANGLLFLNPGSISLPRGTRPFKSYAIIEATVAKYKVTYYDRTHQMIPGLQFVFKKV